jgi:hypothetical protein
MRDSSLLLAAALLQGCVGGRAAAPVESIELDNVRSRREEPSKSAAPQAEAIEPRVTLEAEATPSGSATAREPAVSTPLVATRTPVVQRSKICLGKAPPPRPPAKGCCYVPRSVWERLLEPAKKHARECQARAIERGDAQVGRLAVHLEADASGAVSLACDSEKDDIADPTFVRCVLEGFRALQLPEADDFCPAVQLTYPVMFER